MLGTTQVIPVPTAAERQGIDTTTFPGDTLTVPVSAAVLPVLNRISAAEPARRERSAIGPTRLRRRLSTRTDQFSVRVDHQISDKASLVTRFSLNQVTGPLTNPDQTAIDPSFGVQFFDHQRNAGVRYTRTIRPHLTSETSLSYIRSTPFFPAVNHTQPGIGFADGLFQALQFAGGIDLRIVQQSLSVQAGHGVGARIARLQVGSGDPGEPRFHDFWDESEWAYTSSAEALHIRRC